MGDQQFYSFTSEKAGMQGIDRAAIQQTIHEATKHSEFYKKQRRKALEIERKANGMKEAIRQGLMKGTAYLAAVHSTVQCLSSELTTARVCTETWLHIDMDMFFASVELRDCPELADKPVAVGSRSMISTANYIARQFGVRSAMPGFIAQKLCPELVFVPLNPSKYTAEGQRIREVFKEFDPLFESHGLDEASLCVTSLLQQRACDNEGGRLALAEEIRRQVYNKTSLTCSAGIACNKMLAKIASDLNKPNGTFYVPFNAEGIEKFMLGMNMRKIPGVGNTSEKTLAELGVRTCREFLGKAHELLIGFGHTGFKSLLRAVLGLGTTQRAEEQPQKSVGASKTFRATSDVQFLEKNIRSFSERLARELGEIGASGKTVTVSLQSYMFENSSKGESCGRCVTTLNDIEAVGLKLLRNLYPLGLVRLVGLRVSNLIDNKARERTLTCFLREKGDPGKGKVAEEHRGVNRPSILAERRCPRCKGNYMMSEHRFQIHVSSCGSPEAMKRRQPSPKPTKKLRVPEQSTTLFSYMKQECQ